LKTDTEQTLWDRRDKLKIMAEIMEVAKESQLKTRIMYMVNLSFSQVNEYLKFLTKMDFLRVYMDNRKKYYETTTKGDLYIENYSKMTALLTQEDVENSILAK
jgi:predicted transcriptional regulator